MKSWFRQLRIVFSPAVTIIILLATVLIACGQVSYLTHRDSLGTLLMNEFGGIIWAEEISVGEAVSWFILFLPVGIAAAIFLHAKMATMLCIEGYRYRRTYYLYTRLVAASLAVVLTVVLLEVAVSLAVGMIGGLRGDAVWTTDGDGFLKQNRWLAYSAVLQFWLFASLITTVAFVIYLVTRSITCFMVAFILPSIFGVLIFSAPDYSNVCRLVNCGMARRLSVEGGFGVLLPDAAIRLLLSILAVAVIGCVVFCRIRKYDCRYE